MDGGARWRLAGLAVGAGLAFALSRTYLFDFAAPALALSLALGMLVGGAVTARPPHPPGAAACGRAGSTSTSRPEPGSAPWR